MSVIRVFIVVFGFVLCAGEGWLLWARTAPGVVVGLPAAAPHAEVVAGAEGHAGAGSEVGVEVEASFLAHMTADDVARGVYALAAEPGGVALSEDQRAAVRPLLVEGAALRERLGELRMERRALRARWLEDGVGFVGVVGAERAVRVAAAEDGR